MRIKFFAIFLSFLFVSISLPAIAQTSLKLAAVDTEKALEESIWGKKAVEEIGKERDEWRKKVESLDKEIADLEEELAKQRAFLDDKDAERKLQGDINDKMQSRDLLIQEGNMSLGQKQEQLLEPILEEMKNVIKKLSMQEGYDIVLEKRLIVLYLNPELDITNRVSVMLDEAYKEKASSTSKKEAEKPVPNSGEGENAK
jgi:outer membrane protein